MEISVKIGVNNIDKIKEGLSILSLMRWRMKQLSQ